MSGAKGRAFFELEIYKQYEQLSRLAWNLVDGWDVRHQKLLGDQLLRACDSIGANIAESVGRGHFKESLHFLYYSRGSLIETQHWLRLSIRRKLIQDALRDELRNLCVSLHRQLNSFIRAQKPLHIPKRKVIADHVTEDSAPYGGEVFGLEPAYFDENQEPRAKSQEPRASFGKIVTAKGR